MVSARRDPLPPLVVSPWVDIRFWLLLHMEDVALYFSLPVVVDIATMRVFRWARISELGSFALLGPCPHLKTQQLLLPGRWLEGESSPWVFLSILRDWVADKESI